MSEGDISDMKHRQASAQWPGYVTYRRADSNAVGHTILVSIQYAFNTARLTSTRDLVGL
jgi:hypothetical protein